MARRFQNLPARPITWRRSRDDGQANNPIKAARAKAGLTQQQAARSAGWTQAAWAQLERMDIDRHSLGRLRKIAAVLGAA